ncbi:S9 family peptidase [Candidatus Azambacteria bacterium]|nr:S9 family peptidase [Candidatus Azambacteria bacterium]
MSQIKEIEEKLNISRITYRSGDLLLEGLIMRPKYLTKFPAIVFIHGHGESAWQSTSKGYSLVKAGYTVFLPSMIGYGLSEGNSDYNGPKTVDGLIQGIKLFLKKSFVDNQRLGIWGISRGAMVSAILITKKPDLFKAAVLQSGAYEMEKNYRTVIIPVIKKNIEKEAGTSYEAFRERSPIYDMDKTNTPILILHGARDENVMVEQAYLLDKKLSELGKTHETVILPEAGHHYLTKETRNKITLPFLEKYLKKLI